MTISKAQITLLHVAKSKLGWDDDLYRSALVRIAGVPGAKELDRESVEAMMGFAEYCGFRPLAPGAPRCGNRPGMATLAQPELIRAPWRELHNSRECDDEALTGWLRGSRWTDCIS